MAKKQHFFYKKSNCGFFVKKRAVIAVAGRGSFSPIVIIFLLGLRRSRFHQAASLFCFVGRGLYYFNIFVQHVPEGLREIDVREGGGLHEHRRDVLRGVARNAAANGR